MGKRVIKEKQIKTKVYTRIWTRQPLEDTETRRKYSCKIKKEEKKWKRDITPAETKICQGQITQTEYSLTQIQELKEEPQPYQNICHDINQREYKNERFWRRCKMPVTHVEEK